MFFSFSSALKVFTHPFTWIIFCFLLYLFFKDKKKKKIALISFVSLLYFFSCPLIYKRISKLIEEPLQKMEEVKQYDIGIVLSGMYTYDPKSDRWQVQENFDRLYQAFYLFKAGKINSIIVTGGKGSLTDRPHGEAFIMKDFLIKAGVPDSLVIAEDKSVNTAESAQFCAEILKEKNLLNQRILIISSASHLYRSKISFEKQGILCDTFSTDNTGITEKPWYTQLFPSAETLSRWNSFSHELLGRLAYKLAGFA